MLHRYGSQGYIKSRRIAIPPEYNKPSVLAFCVYQIQFGYDSVRLFDGKNKRLRPLKQHVCHHCYRDELKLDPVHGSLICVVCGTVVQDRMTDSEVFHSSLNAESGSPVLPREYRNNVVKRVNHFKYWIQRIQGTETHRVSSADLETIRVYLHRTPDVEITYDRIRYTLRILHKRHLYNNTYYILRKLTGEALVQFDRHHEEALLHLFRKIQTAYAAVRAHRVNMLSYSFLIKKFCEIYGWQEIAFQIPTLRSRDKLRDQDAIWKDICHYLKLPYYAST